MEEKCEKIDKDAPPNNIPTMSEEARYKVEIKRLQLEMLKAQVRT